MKIDEQVRAHEEAFAAKMAQEVNEDGKSIDQAGFEYAQFAEVDLVKAKKRIVSLVLILVEEERGAQAE